MSAAGPTPSAPRRCSGAMYGGEPRHPSGGVSWRLSSESSRLTARPARRGRTGRRLVCTSSRSGIAVLISVGIRRHLGGAIPLGDPEIEELGKQAPPPALDHHDVRWLQVAVDDPQLVHGVDDLAEGL